MVSLNWFPHFATLRCTENPTPVSKKSLRSNPGRNLSSSHTSQEETQIHVAGFRRVGLQVFDHTLCANKRAQVQACTVMAVIDEFTRMFVCY